MRPSAPGLFVRPMYWTMFGCRASLQRRSSRQQRYQQQLQHTHFISTHSRSKYFSTSYVLLGSTSLMATSVPMYSPWSKSSISVPSTVDCMSATHPKHHAEAAPSNLDPVLAAGSRQVVKFDDIEPVHGGLFVAMAHAVESRWASKPGAIGK